MISPAGVLRRFIGDTVSLLHDVVNYATSTNVPVVLLSLDQEKAFDRVDWGFLRSVLVHMGFGPSFVSWVDLFYSGVQSAVKVNGYLTHFFKLSRGVRQGCPLSPLLYFLFAEVLPCTPMIPFWWLLLPMPPRQFLKPIASLHRVRVLVWIRSNLKVCG